MRDGLIEDIIRWDRRGLSEPWLENSFLADLSSDALRRLERHASLLRSEGGNDWRPGTGDGASAPVAIVLSGAVKVFHTRCDGSKVLINVAGPGDVLNADACFTGAATIIRFAWSGDARLIAISCDKFRQLVAHDEEIQRALTHALARQVQVLTIQRGYAGRKVEQRLWAFLVDLARRHGTPLSDAYIMLNIGLTQADLAAAVGASSNSVETALRTLREIGKLTTGYAKIVLHELPTEEELDKSFCNWNGRPTIDRVSDDLVAATTGTVNAEGVHGSNYA